MKAVAFYLTLVKALLGFALCCHSAEPLDLSILQEPVAVAPAEPLDLAILSDVPATASACEALDLSILSDAPVPAVKPSSLAIEFGKETANMPRPMAVIDWMYPTRANHWTHPKTIRQHVMEGVHAGKLTAEQVAMMTDAELEAWHSDDHEHKAAMPVKVEKIAEAVKPAVKRATIRGSDGITYYQHADNVYRASKEPGVCYCGEGKCNCGACPGGNCPVVKTPAAPVHRPAAVYQSACPGGVCPTRPQTKTKGPLARLIGI